MKVLVYHGPGKKPWEEKPKPTIAAPTDVKPGGNITNIGVHGKPVDLHLDTLWIKNIMITTGLVDTYTTPMLFKVVQLRKLEPKKLITHHFKLNDILHAYDVFGNAAKEKALKVILEN